MIIDFCSLTCLSADIFSIFCQIGTISCVMVNDQGLPNQDNRTLVKMDDSDSIAGGPESKLLVSCSFIYNNISKIYVFSHQTHEATIWIFFFIFKNNTNPTSMVKEQGISSKENLSSINMTETNNIAVGLESNLQVSCSHSFKHIIFVLSILKNVYNMLFF